MAESTEAGDASNADIEESDTPVHPIPAMQGAFEESILEAGGEQEAVPNSPIEADATVRRHHLLESKQFDESWTTRWKQSPAAQHHPLTKLMAQIIFGMHLLHQHQAKSDKEVVKILQTHVNEVDTFLERTAEDFAVATKDVEDRIRYLKLPMTHLDVFENMLDNKKFRTQLLAGNEKIEKIIDRTTRALNAALSDVEQGVLANKELGRYVRNVQEQGAQHQRAIVDVFTAMQGNEQGWKRYLKDLQIKGNTLRQILIQLQRLIAGMSRMAAAASRRNKTQSSTINAEAKSAPSSSAGPRSKFSQGSSSDFPSDLTALPQRRPSNLNKPLPVEPPPVLATSAPAQDSAAKPRHVPFAERYERPRQSPPEPSSPETMLAAPRPRPRTAREARAADSRTTTHELLQFFRDADPGASNFNPLRSNPPISSDPLPPRVSAEQPSLGRKASHGTNLIMGTVSFSNDGRITRSKGSGILSIPSPPSVSDSHSPPQAAVQKPSIDTTRSFPATIDHVPAMPHDAVERRAAMKDTGFARRLSKRLKHLPLPTPLSPSPRPSTAASTSSPPTYKPTLPSSQPSKPPSTSPSPADSAYGSWPGGTGTGNASPSAPHTTSDPLASITPRPIPVLAPLPSDPTSSIPRVLKAEMAATATAPDVSKFPPPPDPTIAVEGRKESLVPPSMKSAVSGKSRGKSLRNAIMGRWRRGVDVA
ncbi:hypothetical protein BDY17DRAFT_325297 [Neohortaea acidophila]|uniref:Uncharacterized protein n=1 Tax=Neohortaea acidophila TaxID=245834 RepID=A0A6A6PQR3_9PEZI|nr:uncharacterized protein BDY17DRAFT_325297 [Neohortaea acidophila]KAF2481783.1 hypothetical protein BDY17DRAFT_325297 [Neohortaea acidophila]